MATQTIQFRSPPSQTVTLRLFVAGSDTQIASASATEATNRKGTYTAAFTDVPASEYQYVATIGSSPIIPVASGYVTLTLTTATFQVYDSAKAINLGDIPAVDADAIADAVATALIQFEAEYPIERSVDDENPIVFSWPNATDTVTGRVKINNGAWQAVSGAIAYSHTDGDLDFYTLDWAAPDRPSAEGTARYEFTAGPVEIFYTLRVEPAGGGTAQSGDWAITRTFQVSGGAKVPGVRMSLVGVDGKSVTTGSSGIATIMCDDNTFTLRVVVPVGYEPVADTTVVIDGANDTATVTLTRTSLVPSVVQGAPSASLALRPAMDRKTPLLTLAAVVDHLLLLDEINPAEPRSVDRASKAARDALSSFASYSTQGFRYYESRAKVVMPGTLAIGSITVTDGVFEVDGDITIPDWAPLAHVRIDRNTNKLYPVLLVNGQNLTVDTLPDGTYTGVYLEQLFFPLPRNFRRRGVLSDGTNDYSIDDMSGGSFQSFQDYYRWIGAGEFGRRFSAITMDQRNQGDLMLSVWPPYESRTELSMFFERYPEAMKHHRVGNSSATLAVTGATATSSHAIFNSSHIGAAITIGTSSDQELLQSLSSESLVETQRIIRYVTSSTVVILDLPVDAALTNRAFYISDIVDVQPGVMTEAYKRLAEHELLRQTKGSKADQKLQEFIRQLQMTQADDARHKPSGDLFSGNVGGLQWGTVNGRPS